MPCTLYNNCSRDCNFALTSHGTKHNSLLFPPCILYFLFRCPSRSVLVPTLSTNSVLSLLYSAVLPLLPGEILLLDCQLPWVGKGLLRVKDLGSRGCMKQLPCPPRPGAWLLSASRDAAQPSQLHASGRAVSSAPAAAHGALAMLCCLWHRWSCGSRLDPCFLAALALPASVSLAVALRWLLPSCLPRRCPPGRP